MLDGLRQGLVKTSALTIGRSVMIALDPADVASDRPRGTKMVKGIFGVVAGLAVWVVLVSIGGLMIRLSWPAYAERGSRNGVYVADADRATFGLALWRLLEQGWSPPLSPHGPCERY